jgi:hypothetical protein
LRQGFSERAILTIQRIVRVSPVPRFVSSVSWHRASPQALTPRSFRPKHDIDDAEESAWGSRGLRQYDGKRVSTLLSDFNSLQASVMAWWWRVRVWRSDFQPSGSHVFGRAVVAPTGSDGMDRRPHIVVVEDETTQRRLLVDYLTRQNFRVSGADGGTALRKLVERDMPALVPLDVGLPGEDGFALARWATRGRVPALAPVRVGRNVAHCRADLAGQIGLRRELAGLRVELADAFGAIMRGEAMRTIGHQNGREPVTIAWN